MTSATLAPLDARDALPPPPAMLALLAGLKDPPLTLLWAVTTLLKLQLMVPPPSPTPLPFPLPPVPLIASILPTRPTLAANVLPDMECGPMGVPPVPLLIALPVRSLLPPPPPALLAALDIT